jgi:hypothetical protein
MAPLILYWICLGLSAQPRPPIMVDMTLLALGLFVYPAAVLVVVLGDSITALTPGNIFRMIVGAPGPYLLTWAALAIVAGLGIIAGWYVVDSVQHSKFGPAIGMYVLLIAVSATGLVMMRVIGLMYRHFKAHLPFSAE